MSRTYTPTIGIEIHVQLATKSKMFCSCNNDSRDAEPNTNVCPVCIALPGTLPVVNKGAVEMAVKLGRGFNAQIARNTSFDRKNYFYPDSPKGYQITQMDEPIIQAGYVEILSSGEFKKIGIHHAHMEEDAGKLVHPEKADYSLVDFNRAGTPLVEIVSEPDMHTPEEAKRYLQEVYNIATTLGITHGDMEHGNFKFDLNISVSDTDKLGTKVELKNLNSFRNAERALSYEIKRQTNMLEKGETIDQETRGWDDAKAQTFSQRGKEQAHDYRYFPEPDIPPLKLSQEFIDGLTQDIVVLPITVRKELLELGLDVNEQDVLISQPKTMRIFQSTREIVQKPELVKKAVNWLVGDYQAWLTDNPNKQSKLTGKNLAELICLVESGDISSKIAKDIFTDVILGTVPSVVIVEKGLKQVSDEGELEGLMKKIIEENPQAVQDFQTGNDRALGFFVGQAMKATKGQANPGMVNKILHRLMKEAK